MECTLNERLLPHYQQLLTNLSQLEACREINCVPDLLQHLKVAWNHEAITDNELISALHWCNQQPLAIGVEQLKEHWLPYRYHAKIRSIQWCLPNGHPTEPFHDEYIGRCQRTLLINQFLRPKTSLHPLLTETDLSGLARPAGFIFHLSRCGSTLLSGCLSELDGTCVLSESQLLTDILLDDSLSRSDKARLLPHFIHLQGSSVGRTEIIIKWNAWDIFHWRLLRQLYSQTPVLLLIRNPLEILASHARQAGRHMSGDQSLGTLRRVFAQEYGHDGVRELRIQVLRELMGEMLNIANEPGVALVDYDALDETRIQQVAEHFGLTIKADERLRVRRRMTVHSKQPDKIFRADGKTKQSEISDDDRNYAWSKLGTIYQQLIDKGTTAPVTFIGVEALG